MRPFSSEDNKIYFSSPTNRSTNRIDSSTDTNLMLKVSQNSYLPNRHLSEKETGFSSLWLEFGSPVSKPNLTTPALPP